MPDPRQREEIVKAIIHLSNLAISRHSSSLQAYAEVLWNNREEITHTSRVVCLSGEKLIPVVINDSEKLMKFKDPDGRAISLLKTREGFEIFRQEVQQ